MWNFWKKTSERGKRSSTKTQKLLRPGNIPDPVGRYLVVELGKNPDWVWHLKSAVRPRQEGKESYDVRVFDEVESTQKNVMVKNYTSLDEHPELILYEGWFDKKSFKVQIEEKKAPPLP